MTARARVRHSWLALPLAAIACSPEAEPEGGALQASYGEPFRLAAGESARLGSDVRVAFARVSDDARCPAGAECAEPGSAAVVLALAGPAGSATLTLHTGREPRRASAAGHTVELVDLRPDSGPPADSARYEVRLVVTPSR